MGSPSPAATPSDATLTILQTLIGFPTISRDSNLGLIEWVRDRLLKQGVKARLSYDAAQRKANLFATLGQGAGPGVILSGHTDVVPIDGQDWSSDPFVALIADRRVYGRGSADMKGYIAAVLAAAPRFIAAEGEPFHIALSYDEEVGCLGAPGLIADIETLAQKPRACIIGEPTNMQPMIGHKGSSVYRCRVHGREAHSSLAPMGANAIEAAARLIEKLRQIGAELATGPLDSGFDVPFTTIGANTISGGVAPNIVARACEFKFDIRSLPGVSADAIVCRLEQFACEHVLPEMRAVAPESEVRIERTGEVPGLNLDAASPLAATVSALSGHPGPAGYVAFGTEGGLFQRAGIASIVCGPGSIAQAHRPDEFVSFEQLYRCEVFLLALSRLGSDAQMRFAGA